MRTVGPVSEKRVDGLLKLGRRVQSRFPNFYLAGGTALMIRHRHRTSVDLDFFSEREFSFRAMESRARKSFPVRRSAKLTDNLDLWIDGVKVSFVFFPYRNRKPLIRHRGMAMASDYDIFLNKIYAAGRRVDEKDPVDAAFLLDTYHWSVTALKRDFERKFPGQSWEIYLGAVLSFEDYPGLQPAVKKSLRRLLHPSEDGAKKRA